MANSTTHYFHVAGDKSLTAQKPDKGSKGELFAPKQTTVNNILNYSRALRLAKISTIEPFSVFVN